jgi:regulator of protease activity HflC (stomatin/prohibitin superfamily)
MPDITDITCGGSSRSGVICKITSALLVVALAIFIACIADSYHKVHEGNVGIYYRHGALKDRVTDPGVHFLLPFFESFKEVQIRPETVQLEPVLAITRDGIENTFREITIITTIRKDKLFKMVKAYGNEFKRTLVYDRIKEDLRIFCANNTIDDVYNVKFLDIVEQVKDNVKTSISRLGEGGIEILNLVIPKPEIPADIAHNYKQVKVQWTEQLVATQQQKTEQIKKETEQLKAVADANRQKAVLEIKIQENIIEVEGKKNVSLINNEILQAAENNKADIEKYKLEQQAKANEALYSDKFIKLNLAQSLSNNTKFYFSGQQSELGSLFNKILGNG